MRVALVSVFMNSEKYMDRFFQQTEDLRISLEQKGHALTLVLGEGDSTDFTRQKLLGRENNDFIFVDVTHGGKRYGSVIDAQRFLQCAYVGNLMLINVPTNVDLVIYVESDLIWLGYNMMRLLSLATSGFDVVAPKVILRREGWPENSWYDTYAFEKDGVKFGHVYPYHDVFEEGKVVEVDSVGSCIVTSGYALKRAWFTAEGAIVGLCDVLKAKGFSIYLDTHTEVWHE